MPASWTCGREISMTDGNLSGRSVFVTGGYGLLGSWLV
jgi:hypothetical protein